LTDNYSLKYDLPIVDQDWPAFPYQPFPVPLMSGIVSDTFDNLYTQVKVISDAAIAFDHFTIDPYANSRTWATGKDKFWKSIDEGRTWTIANPTAETK